MKSFEDKWYTYMEEKEELYEMKSVFWYKTEDEFIPFILNSDQTKIKILTTRKEYEVLYSPMACYTKESNGEYVYIPKMQLKGTLKNITMKNGEIFDSATVLEKYYFSDDIKSGVKDWVKTHTRSQEEIVRMARYINKDYKKQEEQQEK